MTNKQTDWPRLLPLFLVIITAVSFWPVRSAQFLLLDDPQHIYLNPYLEKLSFERIWYFWRYPFDRSPVAGIPPARGQDSPPYQEIYTPLTFTAFALVAPLARLSQPQPDPVGIPCWLDASIYHSMQLALHIVNVLLAYFLLRRLTRTMWGAALAALFFAVNPLQVEAVARVSAANNALSTFFLLSSCWAYLSLRQPEQELDQPQQAKAQTLGRLLKSRRYYLALGYFVLALLAKPSAAVLPGILLTLELGWPVAGSRVRLAALVPWLLIGAYFVRINQNIGASALDTSLSVPWYSRLLLMGDSFAFYTVKLAWPWRLSMDYGRRPEFVLHQWWGHATWLLPVLVLAAFIWAGLRPGLDPRSRRLWRQIAAGYVVFLIALLPTSGLVPFYFQIYSVVADRYAYLALFGISLMLATAIQFLAAENQTSDQETPLVKSSTVGLLPAARVPVGALVAFLLCCGTATFFQSQNWHDDGRLFTQSLQVNPASALAHNCLAAFYSVSEPRKAVEEYTAALRLRPDWDRAHQGLALAYNNLGELTKSEAEYKRTLELRRDSVSAVTGLGVVYSRRGRWDLAERQFAAANAMNPGDATTLNQLGVSLCRINRPSDGGARFREALDAGLDPVRGHTLIGMALNQERHYREASSELQTALQLDPNQFLAHFYLAKSLQNLGEFGAATEQYQSALTIRPDAREAAEIRRALALCQAKR